MHDDDNTYEDTYNQPDLQPDLQDYHGWRKLKAGETLRASDHVWWSLTDHRALGHFATGEIINPDTSRNFPEGFYRRPIV